MQHDINLSVIRKISADLDTIAQQERETNVFAINELKEYVKSKLEESFQDAKNETNSKSIDPPIGLGVWQTLSFILKRKEEAVIQLSSLLEESKTKISNLDSKCLFETLKIIFTKGFVPACTYVLDQPIIITPKPYPGPNSKII